MRTRQQRKREGKGREKGIVSGLWWKIPLLGALVATLVVLAALFTTRLPEPNIPVASMVFDRNNQLIARLFVENRVVVPLAEIPADLQNAVIGIEDERFFLHFGIDPIGIARAALRNIQAGRIVQGGSTITQQLARGLFLTPERTLSRKIREALLTLRLELELSKEEILALYLNQIYLGHGTYGVEAASQAYFGKPVRELDLAESALIAGLIRSPETLSPYRNLSAALDRRNLVLAQMARLKLVSPERAVQAQAEPIRLVGLKPLAPEAAYFVDYVTNQVLDRHPELKGQLFRGGYRIFTTLDARMQKAAFDAFQAGLGPGEPDARGVLQPQGALVAIDPANGYIVSMIGGRDFSKSPFNRAVNAHRQPGSAFKPFLYTAVIDRGFTAASTQVCEPVEFPSPGQQPYRPKDFTGTYHFRPLDIREAIAVSDNVVAVRWGNTVKPRQIIRYARAMGIESDLAANLSLSLGSSAVTPLELVRGYVPLANLGLAIKPLSVLRVEDRFGNVIEENAPEITRVLDERTAFMVSDLLRSVLEPGGTGSHLAAIVGRPAAGKTGTTDNRRDAWFVGFTPDLVAGVYVGNDDPEKSLPGVGGQLAGPIWARFMAEALAGTLPREFPRPDGIVEMEICTLTGLLPNPTCPTRRELFIRGTEPRQVDPTWHGFLPPPGE